MHPLESLKRIFGTLLLAVIALIAIFFFVSVNNGNKNGILSVDQNEATSTYDYSAELSQIEAKSFYVYDIDSNQVLFSKNEHEKLPLASITKLMTGFVALDVVPDTSTVKITEDDIALGSGTGLVVGESWKLRDLLNFSLISSSNDGMHAIASLVDSAKGVDIINLMNDRAKNLGLNDTIFLNETGLDVNGDLSGAYSSSYDVTKLFIDILTQNPSLVEETKNPSEKFISESNIVHYAVNTDEAINKIPSLIASKTGFTDLAGGNLAVVFDGGLSHPIVAVVLGSSESGRFTDIEKLVNLSLRKLSGTK